jgi:hypothetical protein
MSIPPELPGAYAKDRRRLGLKLFHIFPCTRMVCFDGWRLATISLPPPMAMHSIVTTERNFRPFPVKPEAHQRQTKRNFPPGYALQDQLKYIQRWVSGYEFPH